jgi:hypothetical protein
MTAWLVMRLPRRVVWLAVARAALEVEPLNDTGRVTANEMLERFA